MKLPVTRMAASVHLSVAVSFQYRYAAASMLWLPAVPGGQKSDPQARGLVRAPHSPAKQEPR
jgi:hypothetical protein